MPGSQQASVNIKDGSGKISEDKVNETGIRDGAQTELKEGGCVDRSFRELVEHQQEQEKNKL